MDVWYLIWYNSFTFSSKTAETTLSVAENSECPTKDTDDMAKRSTKETKINSKCSTKETQANQETALVAAGIIFDLMTFWGLRVWVLLSSLCPR